MKIRPVGAELFRAYADIKHVTVAFRNYANAPENREETGTAKRVKQRNVHEEDNVLERKAGRDGEALRWSTGEHV